jgi:hypothetical protein
MTEATKAAEKRAAAAKQAVLAEANRKRLVRLHQEILQDMLAQPRYGTEVRDSLRRGGEAYIADLQRTK